MVSLKSYNLEPNMATVKQGSLVQRTLNKESNLVYGLHSRPFGIVEGISPFGTKTISFKAVKTSTNGQAIPIHAQEHGETLIFNVV